MPLDHWPLLPRSILGGTRTPNLEIRSLTPYPLGHEDCHAKGASGGGRTLDLRAMNPTRCQLRHRGLVWEVPRAGFEPAHSFEYLNLSQAP